MSKAKLFIVHEEVDRWMDALDIDLQADSISLPDLPGPLGMEPAIFVTRQVAGDEDTADLVGRIMPVSALDEQGLEYFQNSVIAGDNAYEAVEGFLISSELPKREAVEEAPAVREEVPAAKEEAASQLRDESPTEIDIPLDMDSGLPTEPEPGAPEPASATPETPAPDAEAPGEDTEISPEDMLARLILEKLK